MREVAEVDSDIWIAILSLLGTGAGSLCGILTSNKLINYRLDRLEEKVSRQQQWMERLCRLEGRMAQLESSSPPLAEHYAERRNHDAKPI